MTPFFSESDLPCYDIETEGIPQFVDAHFTELDKIEYIQRFRSGYGIDSSDDFENCRIMKNAYIPFEEYMGDIELEKSIKDGEDWVNTYHAHPGEIIRFRITVTYHDVDGPDGTGYLLKNINIVDTLPDELTYLGNSTHEENEDGQIITWELDNILNDTESVSVEFDAEVMLGVGEFVNNVEVFAIESCYGADRYESATATVIPEYNARVKYMDVDDDDNDEEAHDENYDLTDGYEVYVDPDESSDDVLNIDGDDDGKIDHFIDVFDKGPEVDRYWDPDDGILSDVYIIDVDYDGTEEWVYDSDGDEEPDKYYDPDDEQIHDYVVYALLFSYDGSGSVQKNPNGVFFLEGFEVEIIAVANSGWKFVNYSGDLESDEESVTITMGSRKEIHVTFEKDNDNEDPISVEITRPEDNSLYIFNIRIKDLEDKTDIVGPIKIKAKVESENEIDKVEFYIDDELKKTDTRAPYNWWWLFKPRTDKEDFNITIIAYDEEGNSSSDSIHVLRSAFTPIRDHKFLSLIIAGLGITYILKNRGTEPDETIPVDPDTEPDSNWEPVVDAGGPYKGFVDEPVKFDGSNTYDPNYDDITFSWDFGDGSKGSGKSPSHTYDKPGKYTVKLTVTDENGASATDTTTVEITEGTGDDTDDEGDLFWYILTALGIAIATAVGLLYFRRRLYV